ncbi:MAG: hypothetical protein MZV65_29220 [Chromatiales bacterium]|nr:hypothetical protein [Chromatiales bacterium]
MKRTVPAGLPLLALAASAWGIQGEIGLLYGVRTLKNADLRGVFGSGTVAIPTLAVRVSPSGSVGLSYESGYKREARVGLFGDLFSLSVSGLELFYRQEWRAGRLTPYLKIGPGFAFYKIHIDSPFLTAYNVKGGDVTFAMALGVSARVASAHPSYGRGEIRRPLGRPLRRSGRPGRLPGRGRPRLRALVKDFRQFRRGGRVRSAGPAASASSRPFPTALFGASELAPSSAN